MYLDDIWIYLPFGLDDMGCINVYLRASALQQGLWGADGQNLKSAVWILDWFSLRSFFGSPKQGHFGFSSLDFGLPKFGFCIRQTRPHRLRSADMFVVFCAENDPHLPDLIAVKLWCNRTRSSCGCSQRCFYGLGGPLRCLKSLEAVRRIRWNFEAFHFHWRTQCLRLPTFNLQGATLCHETFQCVSVCFRVDLVEVLVGSGKRIWNVSLGLLRWKVLVMTQMVQRGAKWHCKYAMWVTFVGLSPFL